MNIFDLFDPPEFTSNVQLNLKMLNDKFGENFYIKYNDYKLPVVLTMIMTKTNKKKYYSMYYLITNQTLDLYPFKIDFIDILTKQINSNSYISNIHRYETISGSQMIEIVLKINKVLNVTKSYIYDGTTINCKKLSYDLSFLKLLQTKKTFYMKFGFDFDINNNTWYTQHFNSKEEANIYIDDLINECRLVKVNDVKKLYQELLNMINSIIQTQSYDKVQISNRYVQDIEPFENQLSWLKEDINNSINELFIESKYMLDLLNNTSNKYLYELMIELFNDQEKCPSYDQIFKYLIDNNMYKIIYDSKEINYKLFDCFKLLKNIRYTTYSYVY
jgi:hypothetical protein